MVCPCIRRINRNCTLRWKMTIDYSYRGIPPALMHSYPSPRDVLLSLFQMINLARVHDKCGIKKYWEEKIESHVQRMGNEDLRMKNSALSKCVYVYHRESDLFFDNCCYRITSSIVSLLFPFVLFSSLFSRAGNCKERLGRITEMKR